MERHEHHRSAASRTPYPATDNRQESVQSKGFRLWRSPRGPSTRCAYWLMSSDGSSANAECHTASNVQASTLLTKTTHFRRRVFPITPRLYRKILPRLRFSFFSRTPSGSPWIRYTLDPRQAIPRKRDIRITKIGLFSSCESR